jgi:hypothetical protein
MEAIRSKAGIISTLLLTVLNTLAGLGIVLPQGADAEGVALLNAAVLGVGALVVHFVKPAAPEAPVEPAA